MYKIWESSPENMENEWEGNCHQNDIRKFPQTKRCVFLDSTGALSIQKNEQKS